MAVTKTNLKQVKYLLWLNQLPKRTRPHCVLQRIRQEAQARPIRLMNNRLRLYSTANVNDDFLCAVGNTNSKFWCYGTAGTWLCFSCDVITGKGNAEKGNVLYEFAFKSTGWKSGTTYQYGKMDFNELKIDGIYV